jgi:hypothetical protein
MKLKNSYVQWIKEGKCPKCGIGEFQFINTEENGIFVNVESKGKVRIKDFWIPSRVCDNPLCEWSKIKKDIIPLNLCNANDAWRLLKK